MRADDGGDAIAVPTMLWLISLCALADDPAPAEPLPVGVELPAWLSALDERGTLPLHRGQLDNGLSVWIQPNDTASVTAMVVFRAGARWETEANSGVSQLLGHMLFVETERWSENEVKAWIPDRGGTWNGYTHAERVAYYFSLGADDLDDGLTWLSQVAFHPTLPAEKLGKEREVVLQERGGRENTVMNLFDSLGFGYRIERDIRRALFGDNPLALDVIGADGSLDAADIGVVQDFYAEHYGPDNAWLVVAGGVDPAEVAAAAERHFGDLEPRGRPADFEPPGPLADDVDVAARAMSDNDEVGLEIGFLVPGRGHPDALAYKLLGKILTRELKEEVRHELGLVYNISAAYLPYADTGRFYVETDGDRDDIPAIREAIHAAFQRAADGELTQEQLDHAKRAYKGQVALALEDNHARANYLAKYIHHVGPGDAFPDLDSGVEAVTLADLERIAARGWRDGNRYEGRRDPVLTTSSATWTTLGGAAVLVLCTWLFARRRRYSS